MAILNQTAKGRYTPALVERFKNPPPGSPQDLILSAVRKGTIIRSGNPEVEQTYTFPLDVVVESVYEAGQTIFHWQDGSFKPVFMNSE